MMDSTVERFEHCGLTVRIGWEEDSSLFNPRSDGDCHLGTMVCWHPDYMLGDFQLRNPDGRGAVDNVFETARGRTSFSSLEQVERYLRLALGAVCVVPLYLFDHSGISMSAGSNYVGMGDTASGGRDAWGNARGWDTTMVGFIYTTAERIRELCGEPQVATDPFYAPRLWPADGTGSGENWPAGRSAVEWIESQLRAEVKVYDSYLRGEVYYWVVETADGDVLESCGGYFPDGSGDGLEYVRQEARETAEHLRSALDKAQARRGRALRRSKVVA